MATLALYRLVGASPDRPKPEIRARRDSYRLIGPRAIYSISLKPGLGKVTLGPSRELKAGESFTLRIEYTPEREPLQPGDAFVVVVPYPMSQPSYIQPLLASEERGSRFAQRAAVQTGFTQAWSSNPDVRVGLFCDPVVDNSRLGEGWHLIATVQNAPLLPGQKLVISYGDTTYGGPGAVTHLATEYEIACMVYRQVNWKPVEEARRQEQQTRVWEHAADRGMLESSPMVRVRGAAAVSYAVIAPSQAAAGQPFPVRVVARDRFGNLAGSCADGVRFAPLAGGTLPPPYAFRPEDECSKEFQVSLGAGTHRIRAASRDGKVKGAGNPVIVASTLPPHRVYWGDLHVHTVESDGLGTVSSAYRYGRDAAGLDFASVTDHLNGVTQVLRENAEAYHEPGRFVTFNAFELSGIGEGGGDAILYFKSPGAKYEDLIPTAGRRMAGTRAGIDEVAALVEKINERNIIIVPHNHAGDYKTYRKGFDNRSVRLIEVYSVWGNSELSTPPLRPYNYGRQPRTVQQALALGYKLGMIASGDDHSGKPGFGSWLRLARAHQSGLVGAYSTALTREGLWEALWNRRVYGTSGERIILDFSLNGRPMGTIMNAAEAPRRKMKVFVLGTADLKEVSIVKNNAVIYRHEVSGPRTSFEYTDYPQAGANDYYYVRVAQQDTHLAWSSPVWVLQKP
ncbi:MAG: DUF3604 domain-containing protein [Bryobacteraceae bacterium]